jgi:tetratricopeptide (TPR) repeat protein
MRRLLHRGVMLFKENQAIQAKPLFEEVVRIAHDLGNVAVEGRAVGNLASVFEATGQHHRAIELYMQCISILRKIGDSRKEARILYNVSHSYLSLERFDEAIDYLNQSLALTDDPQTRQAVEQQLAVVRHAMIQQSEMEDDDRLMDF